METVFKNREFVPIILVDCLINHHNFIYDGEDFFEYKDGIGLWEKLHDNEIEDKIGALPMKKAEEHYTQDVIGRLERRVHRGRIIYAGYELTRQMYNLINVPNGMLDVRTKELLPYKKEYYCRTRIPVKYQPGADAPRFKQLLEEILEGDQGKTLTIQEFMGCVLLPRIPSRANKGLFLLGENESGGDILMHVLSRLIGQENIVALDIPDLSKRDDLLLLKDKLLNMIYNTPEETCLAPRSLEAFEIMVSGGQIKMPGGNFKNDAFLQPIAKHIFYMNYLPRFIHEANGLPWRLIIVKLNPRFIGNAADILPEDKLSEELPGILNWALEGLSRVLGDKGLLKNRVDWRLKQMLKETRELLNEK